MKRDPELDHFRELLTDAAGKGALSTVQFLLKRSPELAADLAAGNDCALGMAASKGHTAVVKFLHEQGASIGGGLGFSHIGFCLAAENGHIATIDYMLEQGINQRDSLWPQAQLIDKALSKAYQNGHADIARMLLEAGGRVKHLVPRPPSHLRFGERGFTSPCYSPEMQQLTTDFNLWFPEKRGVLSVLMNGVANWPRPNPPVILHPQRTRAESLIHYLKDL